MVFGLLQDGLEGPREDIPVSLDLLNKVVECLDLEFMLSPAFSRFEKNVGKFRTTNIVIFAICCCKSQKAGC